MSVEFILTNDGIGLTERQLDDCRAYAIATILHSHIDEFEAEYNRLVGKRLAQIKAEFLSGLAEVPLA